MAVKKGGLGRGLESLFNENSAERAGAVTVNINDIEPNRNQPRREFDEQSLADLAESISNYGLIQPIVVRPNLDGTYMIIAGERRWRACRIAGLKEVPVIIKETDDKTLMEIALIENLQREDLNAIEEALGYKALIEDFSLTQEQVAEKMGKSRSAVTNALRLLALNPAEIEAIKKGIISAGHARALLSCDDLELRQRMLNAAADGASVRELERMAAAKKIEKIGHSQKRERPKFYSEVELALKNEIGRKVYIKPTSKGRGTLTIEFYNDTELAEIAEKLAKD